MSNVGGEFVTIRIKVNADTREINRVNRKLAEMGVQAQLADKSTSDLSTAMSRRFEPSAKKMKSRLESIGSALSGFNKLALKVFGVTFIIAAASLASVNALFATGRFLVQAYRITMQALAVGVTAVGAGLATVAAAQREYNAALYAYSYKASPALGKGMNQSRSALRMLQSDSTLAVFGMEALNSSFATLSKSGQVTGRTIGALKAFADFAAAGGDPTKNLQGIAEVLAIVEKKGKLTWDAIEAAGNVNEAFATALKRANKEGKTSYADLVDFIEKSGIKAELGIEGQSELLGNTLVGKFKRFTTQIRNLFADIGQPLLGPVSEAFEKMFRILRLGVLRLAPDFIKFGSGRMLDGLVKAVEKLTNAFVNLTRKYLGGSEGMLQKFNNFWQKTVYVFNRVVDAMRPLLDGGRKVIDIFGPVLGEVFGGAGNIIKQLDRVIVANSEEWAKFGKALKDAVTLLADFLVLTFDVLDRALPVLTPLIEAFTELARAIMLVPRALSSLPSSFGPLGALLSMFGLIFAGKGLKNMALPGAAGRASRSRFGQGISNAGGRISNIGGAVSNAGSQVLGNAMYMVSGGASEGLRSRSFWRPYGEARDMGFNRRDAFQLARHDSGRRVFGRVGGGAGLAAGLGLGLLTPFVDEKAQSAVAGGSMLSSLAPMMGKYGKLGLAGGFAMAGIGTAMNARTGGGGAMGGAMAGAAIGSFIPGVGTIGGALIGGVMGFLKGKSNALKAKVNKMAQEKTYELYNSLAGGMASGNTDFVRQQMATEGLASQRRQIMPGASLTEIKAEAKYQKNIQKTQKVLEGPLKRFDKVITTLEQSTGKTKDQLMQLANEIGLNLYDDSIAFTDVIKQMGSAMSSTGEQIQQSMYDMAMGALGVFDEAIQKLEAQSILDEQVDAMRELFISGNAQEKDILEFVKSYGEQLMVLNPDKPLAVIQELFDQFGVGGYAFKPGQAFEGFSGQMTAALAPIFEKILLTMPQTRENLQAEIAGGFAARGYEIDGTQLSAALAKVTDFQGLQTLLTALSTGGMFSAGVGGVGIQENLNNILRSLGITNQVGLTRLTPEEPTTFEDMSAEESAIRAQFMSTMESFFAEQPPEWMRSNPPWWTNIPTGDTSTPRGDTTSARLGRTLSRHNALNGQIAGKRTMTSSYRTTGLGSINSDHIMGRAYDLVGQNLGAYSKLVNDSGGFAEFHGFGGGRHLHVVPGEGPMGDTSLPSMATTTPVTPTSNTNNFNITVNGGSDSAQTIARHVMDEIARAQRSARERR